MPHMYVCRRRYNVNNQRNPVSLRRSEVEVAGSHGVVRARLDSGGGENALSVPRGPIRLCRRRVVGSDR